MEGVFSYETNTLRESIGRSQKPYMHGGREWPLNGVGFSFCELILIYHNPVSLGLC